MHRNSRIQTLSNTESQDDYFEVTKSAVSQENANTGPSCCEFAYTDYLITMACLSMLLITMIGYITIFVNDHDSNGDNKNFNTTIQDYPFPKANTTFTDDTEYTEFFLRCRVSVEKQFMMGCSRIEAQLVMKDTARVFNPNEEL